MPLWIRVFPQSYLNSIVQKQTYMFRKNLLQFQKSNV